MTCCAAKEAKNIKLSKEIRYPVLGLNICKGSKMSEDNVYRNQAAIVLQDLGVRTNEPGYARMLLKLEHLIRDKSIAEKNVESWLESLVNKEETND